MKLENLKTKIFLDSGDPVQTREIINLLGFLDGQTTNPTLILKNADVAKRLDEGRKFTKDEIFDLTKKWQEFDVCHELTDKGIQKFSKDWNSLISPISCLI